MSEEQGASARAGSDTPKGKPDTARIKATLSKLKLKREESGLSTPGGGGRAPPTPTLDSNAVRKKLQSFRAKAREGGETPTGDVRRSSSRLGPRSPLKSAQSTRRRGFTFDDDADAPDEEEELDEGNEEEEEDDTYIPIMKINSAEQSFPLSFVPKSRATENELQTVVLVPAPYISTSDVTNSLNTCVRAAGMPCRCFSCCKPGVFLGQDIPDEVLHERDFLNTGDNFGLIKWAEAQKITSPDLLGILEQLNAIDAADGNSHTSSGLPPTTTTRNSNEECEETDSLFDMSAARVDGIFNDNPPLLASVLLDSEHVPTSIAPMSAGNLQLSRATQRILRDLVGGIKAQQVRKKWKEMNKRDHTVISDDSAKRPDIPGEVHLLQQLSNVPVLQIIENPVTGGNTQPLVPKTSLGFGGQLGQWGADGSMADKFGGLPRGWSGRKGGQRAKFKLHIHQLIVTDHPLMSPEERQLVHLKAIYSQYRSLFEQKILEFLTLRLLSLTTELEHAVGRFEHREPDEEELLALKGTYRDLIETLPALNKLNEAVDSLSSNVYEGWREIQDLRLRSGVTRTTADLTVRKVRSDLVAPPGSPGAGSSRLGRRAAEENSHLLDAAQDSSSEDGNTGEFWGNLKKSLLATPHMLKKAQELIFKKEDEEEAGAEEEDEDKAVPLESARGSEFGGSQVAITANEKLRARQAAQARVIKVISSAVSRLVNNNGLIPKYALRLSETGQITPDNQLPLAELKRRAVLRSMKVRAAVKINGKIITSTLHHPLKPLTLSVDFNRYFEFRVLHQPMAVTLDLFMSTAGLWGSTDSFLATVTVPFPAQCTTAAGSLRSAGSGAGASASSARGEGGRHQHVSHSFTPTTGWYSFASQLVEGAVDRRIEGAVLCTAEYDVSALDGSTGESIRAEDVALIPAEKPSLRSVTTSPYGKAHDFTRENDFQVLLPELSEIDVNDPDNDHLLYLKSKRLVGDDSDVFRLYGAEFGSVFCGEDGHMFSNYVKYKETPRMKLLQLRCVKPYLFNTPIPINETVIKHSELYKSIFQNELHETMARIGAGERDDSVDHKHTSGMVSANTAKVTSFLQRIRSSQTALSRKRKKKNYVTTSVVVETDYITLDELHLVNILERKRSLRPKVKVRNPVSVQVDKCELLVQIVGAKNVPLRSEHDGMSALAGGTGTGGTGASAGLGESMGSGANQRRPRSSSGARGGMTNDDAPIVSEHMLDERKMKEKRRARSFVEVKFQGNTISTVAMDGGTPMWRESLSLPFKAPQDDFTPSSLEQVREEVYFTLFDEVIEDDSERGGLLEGESPIRVEKRYLGSFSVPFETIYTEGRVEGVFRLDTPAINFGYDHAASAVSGRRKESSNMFEGNETEEEKKAAEEKALVEAQGTMWGTFMRLLECLSQTHSQLMLKHPDDSLYYSGSHLHHDTQSEFSFFASDDSATYVKVLITLDPLLTCTPAVPEEVILGNMMHEDRSIGAYARYWLRSIKALGSHTANRKYRLFGTNSSGYNVFIPRYLAAQQPPPGYESRRACVHLIANIPFMNDAQSFIGEMDLWCTSSQFWEVGAGDEEEHAVTLFNYLYYLSLKSGTVAAGAGINGDSSIRESVFLVLGKAVPEGDSVYVMIRDHKRASPYAWEPQNFLFINPWTGYIYSGVDPNCPLREVYILATKNNVWANVQQQAQPSDISFDIANSSLWRPFFGSRFSLPKGGLNTVQTEIEYLDTSPGYALEIEKSIFQAIRNRIRKWRSKRQKSTTTFHPDACAVMHDLLPKMENWKRCGNPEAFDKDTAYAPVDQHAALVELQRLAHDKMKNLLRTRTLRGFPMNVPFTDVEELLTRVRTMCVHEANHPEVQFVMAVRAFPLYNNIVSLWVFLGTLEPTGN